MWPAIALAFVTLSEASIGIFVKLAGDQIPIFALNFYRVFFAALFIWLLVAIVRKQPIKFPNRNIRDIAIIGALIALQVSLFNLAMTLTPVANAVVFWSIAPFFVGILSTVFLKERPKLVYIPVFIVAFIGIIIAEPVSLNFSDWTQQQLGNAIAFGTGAVYAALVTYMRSEGKTEKNVDVLWFMVAASIYLFPGLFIMGPGDLFAQSNATLFGAGVPVIVWAVALGVVSTGLAYFCIGYVLKYINANLYSLIDIIVSPLVAAFFAFLVFQAIPSTNMMIGGSILLLSGATLTLLRDREEIEDKHVVTHG